MEIINLKYQHYRDYVNLKHVGQMDNISHTNIIEIHQSQTCPSDEDHNKLI